MIDFYDNHGKLCHIMTQEWFRKRYVKNLGKEFVWLAFLQTCKYLLLSLA